MKPRRVYRVAGVRVRSGVRTAARGKDGLPTRDEMRELASRLPAHSNWRSFGRPGRAMSPKAWRYVLAKLRAAARSGRGIRFLTRNELDAVLARLDVLENAGFGRAEPQSAPGARQAGRNARLRKGDNHGR